MEAYTRRMREKSSMSCYNIIEEFLNRLGMRKGASHWRKFTWRRIASRDICSRRAAREKAKARKHGIRCAFRACEAHAWRISSHNSRQLRRIVKPRLDGGDWTDGRAEAAFDTEIGMRHAPAKRADGTDILARAARRLQAPLDAPCRRQADLFQSDATFPEIFFSIIAGCRGFFEVSCTHRKD